MTAGEQVQQDRDGGNGDGQDDAGQATAADPGPGRRTRPQRRSKADPNLPPFSDFLERDAVREGRERGRRRTLLISLGVHVLVFAGLLVYSLMQVDELTGPSVEVKLFTPGKLPPGVKGYDQPDPRGVP
jgi:hypothetical protein